MMRLTIAGLAMATTLVFATATPLGGFAKVVGRENIPSERLTAADALDGILEAKRTIQSDMAKCKKEWTTLCYLMDFGLLAKKNPFRQLTQGREKMDMGDLKRLDAENLWRNPKCRGWPSENYAKIIELFDTDGDRYLDFSEWVVLDWVLMVEETGGEAVISRYDEKGCRVFNL